MTTKSTSRNELVGFASLSFIRNSSVVYTISDVKPSTRFYAFFDGVSVDEYCQPDAGAIGNPIYSNSAGKITGVFHIPAGKFHTGNSTFKVQDTPLYDTDIIPGSQISSASASYTTAGFKSTFQKTIDNVTTIVNTQNIVAYGPNDAQVGTSVDSRYGTTIGGTVVSCLGDPLAQTFFTYGIKGGCFVTDIDIYFQSKDASIPVQLELREVQNGYPAATLISKYSKVSIEPANVNITDNATVPTRFIFPRPIYLKEDADYCFVLLSNSNAYNVWTSELGSKSIETGATIFEQPYIGTLFKSENNRTWNAYQSEDIKFTIHKAVFDTNPRTVVWKSNMEPEWIRGTDMSVVSGSPIVTVSRSLQHGFRTGDKIQLAGTANAVYRGIPVSAINNTAGYPVTVVNDYSYTFQCGASATSTGTLETVGRVMSIDVDAGGAGYTLPTVNIVGNGAGATAVATVVSGVVTSIEVTNHGSGYTAPPVVTLTDSIGSNGAGAVLTAICDAIFNVSSNKKYQIVNAIVPSFFPSGTDWTTTLKSTSADGQVGTHEEFIMRAGNNLGKDGMLVSPLNEAEQFGNQNTTEFVMEVTTDNSNVSPMIYLDEYPRLRLYNNIINDILTNPTSTFDPNTELTPSSGQAYSRYISKPITLAMTSKGARVTVTAASIESTSFNVYLRTSMSSSSTPHRDGNWQLMECDVERNLSRKMTEFKDYEFYLDDIDEFDVYDVKIVLSSNDKHTFPTIDNYRLIILST